MHPPATRKAATTSSDVAVPAWKVCTFGNGDADDFNSEWPEWPLVIAAGRESEGMMKSLRSGCYRKYESMGPCGLGEN
jgi:hypothetical protein